jgi:hypothetical protein
MHPPLGEMKSAVFDQDCFRNEFFTYQSSPHVLFQVFVAFSTSELSWLLLSACDHAGAGAPDFHDRTSWHIFALLVRLSMLKT